MKALRNLLKGLLNSIHPPIPGSLFSLQLLVRIEEWKLAFRKRDEHVKFIHVSGVELGRITAFVGMYILLKCLRRISGWSNGTVWRSMMLLRCLRLLTHPGVG